MTEAVVDQRRTVDVLGFANPLNLPANAESATHIYVYGDDVLLTNGVEYELDGIGDLGDLDAIAGVDVLFDADFLIEASSLYSTFTVEHAPPADQQADLSGGGTLGRIYEAGLDAIMRRLQAFYQNFIQRSLQLPPNAIDIDVVLPVPEDRRTIVWELDQDSGEYRLVNSYSDPDTEPLTSAEEAADRAETAEDAAEAARDVAISKAAEAADSADRAEDAAAEAGDLSALLNFLWPVGASMMFNGRSAPANFLKENDAAVSRATYSALWSAIHTEATVTVDVATDLWTWTAHGLTAGDTVRFYNSGGALPTGITANTTYYVISSGLTANAFKVSATSGGSAINMTGTPSGTHTAVNAPYGYGDGSTTFNVPESRGEFIRGLDDSRGIDSGRRLGAAQSEQIGPHSHTATIDSGGAHTHTYGPKVSVYGANGQTYSDFRPAAGDSNKTSVTLTTTSNGDHTHTITINNNSGTENRPRNVPKLICIKY